MFEGLKRSLGLGNPTLESLMTAIDHSTRLHGARGTTAAAEALQIDLAAELIETN